MFSIYLGTVVGAGFATGREIAYFFARYGRDGLKGCLVTGVLLGAFGAITITQAKQGASMAELTGCLGGALRMCVIVAGVCVVSGVLASSDRVCMEQLNMPRNFGALLMCGVSYLVIKGGFRRVGVASAVMAPVLLFWAIWLGGSSICEKGEYWYTLGLAGYSEPGWGWLGSALIYFLYNFLVAFPALESASKSVSFLQNGGQNWTTVALAGLTIGLMAFGLCVAELLEPDCLLFEIPALRLSSVRGDVVRGAYFIVLTMALTSTAIGALYGLISGPSRKLPWAPELLSVMAVLLAQLGLGTIVERLYPLLSIGGFLLVFWKLGGVAFQAKNKTK